MAEVYIYDSGHAKTDNSDPAVEKANNGQPLALWGLTEVDFDTRNNIDKGETIENRTFGTYHFISSALTTIELKGMLAKDGTGASKINDVSKLIDFKFNPTYKVIYVGLSEGEPLLDYNERKQKFVVYWMARGHKDSGANFSSYETTYEHIHIWIEGVDIEDTPFEVRYTIYGVIID